MTFRFNPLTLITLAASAVALTLIADSLWVSAGMLVAATLIAVCTGSHPRRALLIAVGIGIPAFAGFMLMYAPFGRVDGWWILTKDGSYIAFTLGLKLMAGAAIGLVIGSTTSVDELMRTIQTRLPARLVYVIGSTFRLFPMAQTRLATIKQIQRTRGVNPTGIRGNVRLVLPLIVGLVDDAAQRARPLQRAGFGDPGPRTVLRPVPDSAANKAIRLIALIITAAVALAMVL